MRYSFIGRKFTIIYSFACRKFTISQGRIYRGAGGLQPPLQLMHQWKMGRVREKKR
jgi:hypothetical protein